MRHFNIYFCILFFVLFIYGCSEKGPAGIFSKRTLHEKYTDKLIQTGLNTTNMGRLWLVAADSSFKKPISISLPYQENGYFGADKPLARTYLFSVTRGEKITIHLKKNPSENFMIYMDVWESDTTQIPRKHILSNDTLSNSFSFEASENARYIMRIQPELLVTGDYHLLITNEPSLNFPVMGKSTIQSKFGVGRDNNTRKHEGVDIFAARGTPAIAASNGVITRVGTNNLGGNIVFMRPDEKNYSLYYAHLDAQTVINGQEIHRGDTIGFVGNSGNAITTSPHLHFGIYTAQGAIDPAPFILKKTTPLLPIKGDNNLLGTVAKTNKLSKIYTDPLKRSTNKSLPKNTIIKVLSTTAESYFIELPNQEQGFIKMQELNKLSILSTTKLKSNTPIYATPDLTAPKKLIAAGGETVYILGHFKEFNFVRLEESEGWVLQSENN